MTDVDFRPDQLGIEEAGQTEVRLVWAQDSGERRTVVLSKSLLPQVFAQLQTQIAVGSGAPINMAAFRPGTTISVTGLQFGQRADHFRLTLFADLPDEGRAVTIPLRISKKEAEECVKAMTGWLRSLN